MRTFRFRHSPGFTVLHRLSPRHASPRHRATVRPCSQVEALRTAAQDHRS